MLYTDSNLSISVITDSKINSIFVKANNHILTKYSNKFKNTSDDLKSKILKEVCLINLSQHSEEGSSKYSKFKHHFYKDLIFP